MLAVLAGAIAVLALAAPVSAAAQQAYPGSPYGDNSSPYANARTRSPRRRRTGMRPSRNTRSRRHNSHSTDTARAQPYAQQQQPYPQQPYAASPYQQQDLSQPAAPVQALSAEDLEQLLAPIALYPDTLLAQILAASTYPAQVAVADQWLVQLRAQGYGAPDQIAAGAQAQTTWDPSVKALTAFPDVLDMMNHNLEWTTNLGNAYYNQPQDVMQTVQVLRDRAEQAGNLESTPQEDVSNDQGYVELAPTNPQVVYVPTYDPWDVYGQPISPYPGFSLFGALGNFFGGAPIQYGLGFALSAFDRMPFGWLAWGLDWLGHALLFDHSDYYTHSATVADWGLAAWRSARLLRPGRAGSRTRLRVPFLRRAAGLQRRGGYGAATGRTTELRGNGRGARRRHPIRTRGPATPPIAATSSRPTAIRIPRFRRRTITARRSSCIRAARRSKATGIVRRPTRTVRRRTRARAIPAGSRPPAITATGMDTDMRTGQRAIFQGTRTPASRPTRRAPDSPTPMVPIARLKATIRALSPAAPFRATATRWRGMSTRAAFISLATVRSQEASQVAGTRASAAGARPGPPTRLPGASVAGHERAPKMSHSGGGGGHHHFR